MADRRRLSLFVGPVPLGTIYIILGGPPITTNTSI